MSDTLSFLRGLCLAGLLLSVPARAAEETPAVIPDLGPVPAVARPSVLSADWQKGPFVEIYVRGFQDSNGDGTGDLQGVIQRLDYLKDLGFRGIWLMPVFHSQDNNHGYTIRNFRKIEPRYGNEDDMRRLLDEAHQRGIGVILDYVINHSAEKHPLFEAGEAENSPYRDWYVCRAERPQDWKAYGDEAWVGHPGRWCYTAFSSHMRDFNLRNEKVLDFHFDNMRYWLNMGVDGFRFDAVGALVENESDEWENQPENYRIMRRVRDLVRSYPNTYMMCEAPGDPVGFTDSCGHAFAFGLQGALMHSVKQGRPSYDLRHYLRQKPVARMATFLSNHDAFAGIRLYDQLDGDIAAYKLAAASYYTLPGVPFTLYGEEIGMSMSRKAGYEDMQIRAPMSWSAEDKVQDEAGAVFHTFGGFTRLQDSWKKKLFRPQANNWRQFNVAAQQGQADSLLNTYKDLIRLRREHAALHSGDLTLLDSGDSPVLAFVRKSAGETLLVMLNYARQTTTLDLKLPAHRRLRPLWPAAADPKPQKQGRQTRFELAPQQALVLSLQ